MNQNYNVDLKQKEENLYKENKELEEKRNEIKNKLVK